VLNILLIDDDPVEHKLIQRMLKDCYDKPYVLRYANTVEKGISVLKTQKIDLILLDDKMQDGLTAQQSVPQLREIADDISMILISSSINADYLKDKTILDVYDIVDKFHLRSRIREGLLQ